MNNTMLGRLQPVDLREVWQNEAGEFTPWLAREDNLTILADALGLDLECQAQEQSVGPFRADIVCKELSSDSLVLIENQLERTNHAHLGQLMTYAAGLDAVTRRCGTSPANWRSRSGRVPALTGRSRRPSERSKARVRNGHGDSGSLNS